MTSVNEVLKDNDKVKINYQDEIIALVRSKSSPKVVKDKLSEYHASDIADVIEVCTLKERELIYRILDMQSLADVFEYLENASELLEEIDIQKAARILELVDADDAVDILKDADPKMRKAWLSLMNKEHLKTINVFYSYEEDEIGSRMSTNFVTLYCNLSIKEAMTSIIKQAKSHDNISNIFVLDENGVYYGTISLNELIIARENDELLDIISTSYPYVYSDEKIDDCIENLKDYSEKSIPVLSDENKVLGVITAQDLIEVVDDEMGEDYAKLAGLTAEEDLKEPIFESVRKRLPWLVLLLGLGLVVSSVVGLFEAVVSQLTMIICFQSLILDMSGNVGTQSLAVTIRVLMDAQLTGKKQLSLILKEMKVGLLNGLLLGSLSFVGIGLYIALFKHSPAVTAFSISACIGTALLLAMVISSLVGTIIPIVFKKIGVDPAVASGPLITTVNDLVAVVTYYGLTWIFIIDIMHITC
ncbi:magnesium transporter [Lachnobacterium bovis]|jgi:magnesium transporter|uniref:Magnesium transporter MgtE n=1 Tax=Lachnobacterium bovis DSM 14045 TaxID=1122142 RepID=A0A1H3H904_9FIRM|nr:magnesium transporter [Lachnobacterium bovis]SDY11695.1 magnesium transporter [Lachnobacterium bovis DSM 14045]